jgi:hypothetical protein
METTIRKKLEGEHIAKEEPAIWVDSEAVMQSGRLILTSRHLIFAMNDAKKPAITIDLDTINSLANETMLTDHNILAIHYLQYDTAKFTVLNYEEWEKAIEEQRMTPHIKFEPGANEEVNS